MTLLAAAVLLFGPACDDCPEDESKTEAGLCGCGVPDEDGDGDAYPTCLDVCPGYDDDQDSDGDGLADGCDPDRVGCDRDGDCDDDRACTEEVCDDGFCVTTPGEELCDWPAEPTSEATNLTGLDAPEDNPEASELRRNLSGAVWNPVSRTLWVARNGGPAILWALHDDDGDLVLPEGAERTKWRSEGDRNFGDLEGLTFGRFDRTDTLYLLNERDSAIAEWRFQGPGDAVERTVWDLTADMPAPTSYLGAEGIAFVPDQYLAAQGFRDALGEPATSRFGTGGLFFVGHQDEGLVYVFDLNRGTEEYAFLGTFHTRADETAGLEFDASTGMLWVFHGGAALTLEATRVSWTEQTNDDGETRRVFDSVLVYDGPDVPEGGSRNLEGFALTGVEDCVDGRRSAFVTTDDGGDHSLIHYRDFPCR